MKRRIETFGSVVGAFDRSKREWMCEMGFGSLLHLAGIRLPRVRALCYWLMNRVDPTTRTFIAPNGDRFPIDKRAVHWILGIPSEGRTLLKKSNKKKGVDQFKGQYKFPSGNTKVINAKSLLSVVESRCSESEFKKAFLMWTLCIMLCTPTACTCKRLCNLVTVAKTAADYDWCSLVLDGLMDNVTMFAKSVSSNRHSNGTAGCIYILVIYYLDRLNRLPHEWNHFPRIEIWTQKQIKDILRVDRDRRMGDFGTIGCLCLSYGSLHPYMSTDVIPSTQMESAQSVADEEVITPVKPRRRATSIYNPHDRMMQARKRALEAEAARSSPERAKGDKSIEENFVDETADDVIVEAPQRPCVPYMATDEMPSDQMRSTLSVADEEVLGAIKQRRRATSMYHPHDQMKQAQKRGGASSQQTASVHGS